MVFLLVLLTVLILIAVDFWARREDRELEETGKDRRSPIFLSPDKALLPLMASADRGYHQSHTWLQPSEKDVVYVGFDNFISSIFTSDVVLKDLPNIGVHLPQGTKVWDVGIDDRTIGQLSPVSGKVVDVNPALRAGVPVPSDQIERSWILKIRADELERDHMNLMHQEQAAIVNQALRDELYMQAQRGEFLNDGGRIDPEFIKKMDPQEWEGIVQRFFPYQRTSAKGE